MAAAPKRESASWRRQAAGRERARCRAETAGPGGGGGGGAGGEPDALVAEFSRYVLETEQRWPLENRTPTALMPPTAVVRVQMDALMRNDWPEPDSGVKVAYGFAMPARVDEILSGQWRPVAAARAWDAAERYLSEAEFGALLRDPMYRPLIGCSGWEMASPMAFHGRGHSRALQAVRVTTGGKHGDRTVNYTFCLQKVAAGAYRDCWMVVGLRVGDYASVQ